MESAVVMRTRYGRNENMILVHKSGLLPIGFTKRGRAIFPVMGGSEPPPPADLPPPSDPPPNDPPQPKPFEPISSQDDLNRIVGERLSRERAKYEKFDEYKTAAEELARIRDGEKTDLQKATEARAAAEKRADEAEHRELQRKVADDKGVPASQAHRLTGKTQAELEADADAFMADYKPVDDRKPRPNRQQGTPSNGVGQGTLESGRERYKARHGMRQ